MFGLVRLCTLAMLMSASGAVPADSRTEALECRGELLKVAARQAEFESRAPIIHVCFEEAEAPPRVRWLDAEGASIDPIARRQRRAEEFTRLHARFAPSLRERIRRLELQEDAILDADLWLAVDDANLPDREAQLASPDEMRRSRTLLRARIDASASRLVERIEQDSRLDAEVLVTPDGALRRSPVVTVRARLGDLRTIGRMPEVADVFFAADAAELEERPDQSEHYYDLALQGILDALGWGGSGIRVAILEGGRPDITLLLNVVPGSCPGGELCACPEAGTAHSKWVGGVITNLTTPRRGLATGARLMFANWGPDCGNHLVDAAHWALDNGARVINRSAGPINWDGRTSIHRLLDYLVTQPPWPFIAITSGNIVEESPDPIVRNYLYNGMVVGAATNSSPDRSAQTISSLSKWANGPAFLPLNPDLWELPHIVAPGENVATGGALAPVGKSGTSFAAPQVAAVAANIMEMDPELMNWPEAIMAGLLVGPEQDVHGVWPLTFTDDEDDRDGVGLLNAIKSAIVLLKRMQPYKGWSEFGYDRGTLSASSFDSIGLYLVRVPAGKTLRAASVIAAKMICEPPIYCLGDDWPPYALVIKDLGGSGKTLGESANPHQNYQYASYHNGGTVPKLVGIKIVKLAWGWNADHGWAVAWRSD